MSLTTKNYFAEVLLAREQEITRQWLELQTSVGKRVSPAEQQADTQKAHEFIRSLQSAVQSGELANIMSPSWDSVREILSELSANRARNGYTPTETATFVFSLKGPITSAIRDELGKDAETLGAALTDTTDLLDKLGLFTMESFQKTREEIISRQQQELLELSTPVVRLVEKCAGSSADRHPRIARVLKS